MCLPQEGGDQSAKDQGQQNRSLVTLFLHLTLVLCKIFGCQIDLGYYKRIVPFPPDLQPRQNGAYQSLHISLWHSWNSSRLITVSFLFNWGADSLAGKGSCQRQVGGRWHWDLCFRAPVPTSSLPVPQDPTDHLWAPGCFSHSRFPTLPKTFSRGSSMRTRSVLGGF